MTIFMEIVFTVDIDRAFLSCYHSESTINVISASIKIKMTV